jgi:putative DNA primase/helicase
MRVDRADRSAHIDKPALTFGLALQPGVLSDLASGRRFRDSGLLARFLFAMPKSNVGMRDVRQRNNVPSYVKREYESRLGDLLDGRANPVLTAPRRLPMTESALEVWLELLADMETMIGEGGRLESIADWGSKLPGAVARIAALIELAESGLGATEVSYDATVRAVSIGRLLIKHAKAAFGILGADAVDSDVMAMIKWAVENNLTQFNKSAAQRAMRGRFGSIVKLNKAIERMEAGDVVRVDKVPNKGARPTTTIHMNPKLWPNYK